MKGNYQNEQPKPKLSPEAAGTILELYEIQQYESVSVSKIGFKRRYKRTVSLKKFIAS